MGESFCNFLLCSSLLYLVGCSSGQKKMRIFYKYSRVQEKIRYFIFDHSKITTVFYDLSYGLILFTLPIIITEIIGFRYKREFVDIYKFWNENKGDTLFNNVLYNVIFWITRIL